MPYYLVLHNHNSHAFKTCKAFAKNIADDLALLPFVDPTSIEVVKIQYAFSCKATLSFDFLNPPATAKNKNYPNIIVKRYRQSLPVVYDEDSVKRDGFTKYYAFGYGNNLAVLNQ